MPMISSLAVGTVTPEPTNASCRKENFCGLKSTINGAGRPGRNMKSLLNYSVATRNKAETIQCSIFPRNLLSVLKIRSLEILYRLF